MSYILVRSTEDRLMWGKTETWIIGSSDEVIERLKSYDRLLFGDTRFDTKGYKVSKSISSLLNSLAHQGYRVVSQSSIAENDSGTTSRFITTWTLFKE